MGFPTVLYVLYSHHLELLHLAVAAVLLPTFLAAVWRHPATPAGPSGGRGGGRESIRRRELLGQLLLVLAAGGLVGVSLVVSLAGLTTVFVLSDPTFLGTTAGRFAAANARLPRLHSRRTPPGSGHRCPRSGWRPSCSPRVAGDG